VVVVGYRSCHDGGGNHMSATNASGSVCLSRNWGVGGRSNVWNVRRSSESTLYQMRMMDVRTPSGFKNG